MGYLHSGFEKTGENRRYKDFVYYTDRMDYISSMTNNLGYVLTVEKLLGIDIPERAQVIRVIMSELQRIASHLLWLSTHVLDVSGTGMSLLMYATRERERILDLFAPKLVLGISDEISSTGDIERIRLVGEIVDRYNASLPENEVS